MPHFRLHLFICHQASDTYNAYVLKKEEIVIVTAFKPFMGGSENITMDIAERIEQSPENDAKVMVLDVNWGETTKTIKDTIAEIKNNGKSIKTWIALGQGKSKITIEAVGRNERGKPDSLSKFYDNSNHYPGKGAALVNWEHKNAPPSFKLQINPTKLQQRLIQGFIDQGIDSTKAKNAVEISEDAGRYICDETSYCLYSHVENKDIPLDSAVFIHIPERATDSTIRAEQEKLYTACANTLIQQVLTSVKEIEN